MKKLLSFLLALTLSLSLATFALADVTRQFRAVRP